jgi:RimJ/RimL family protein N-acetyltransferase
MPTPYRLVTERLELRCWDPREAPALKAALDDSLEHLRAWMPWAHEEPSTPAELTERLRGFRAGFDRDEFYFYGAWMGDEVVGGPGLHRRVGDAALEIGYWIRAGRTQQGLAAEAASALTRAAFELCGVERVEIHVDPRNAPSLGVPRKLGYAEEATLRRRLPPCPPGAPRGDVTIFSLLDEEFRASPLAAFPLEAYDAAGNRVIQTIG